MHIENALSFIEENLDQPITLAEISNKCCMSRYHFTRAFKKAVGQSFKEYHNRRRIEEAQMLLVSGHHRVTEVCYEVGYNDLSYFNRLFRRYAGLSPSSYRAKFQSS